ncbi:MAG: hypothetical protein AB7O28_10885 [Vicinamibacterales bacterium]
MRKRVNTVSAQWVRLMGAARERWDRLTDEDLLAVRGNSERLISLLQDRYGFARDQALKELIAWRRALSAAAPA